MISQEIKSADTTVPIHPLIAKRWSPRAFSEDQIPKAHLQEMLEAARWAASSRNAQPWRYVYAYRGTEGFTQIWNTLMPGNQPWAQHASVLMVAIAETHDPQTGKANGAALHDLGMANAQMILQAASRDIYAHMMGGFHRDKAQETLELNEFTQAVAVIAFGYRTDAETLEEPFRSRELAERSRKPVSEFATER